MLWVYLFQFQVAERQTLNDGHIRLIILKFGRNATGKSQKHLFYWRQGWCLFRSSNVVKSKGWAIEVPCSIMK